MSSRARYLSLLAAWIVLVAVIAWSAASTQRLVQESEALAVSLRAETEDQLCLALQNDFEVLQAIKVIAPDNKSRRTVEYIAEQVGSYLKYFCADWVQPNLRPDFEDRLAQRRRELEQSGG